MSDEELRRLEKAWRETGAEADALRLRAALERAGRVPGAFELTARIVRIERMLRGELEDEAPVETGEVLESWLGRPPSSEPEAVRAPGRAGRHRGTCAPRWVAVPTGDPGRPYRWSWRCSLCARPVTLSINSAPWVEGSTFCPVPSCRHGFHGLRPCDPGCACSGPYFPPDVPAAAACSSCGHRRLRHRGDDGPCFDLAAEGDPAGVHCDCTAFREEPADLPCRCGHPRASHGDPPGPPHCLWVADGELCPCAAYGPPA